MIMHFLQGGAAHLTRQCSASAGNCMRLAMVRLWAATRLTIPDPLTPRPIAGHHVRSSDSTPIAKSRFASPSSAYLTRQKLESWLPDKPFTSIVQQQQRPQETMSMQNGPVGPCSSGASPALAGGCHTEIRRYDGFRALISRACWPASHL